MSQESILLIMGGAFILLGLVAMLWGRVEQRSYDASLSTRRDLREYLDHWPPRIEAKALIIGGWISIVVGVVLMGMATWFLYVRG
ncbi:MAG: hypothetical protein HYX81_00075 [Chloroflexi bacterium]|nr:hypothetical protein [Chloroflexota bacterium]